MCSQVAERATDRVSLNNARNKDLADSGLKAIDDCLGLLLQGDVSAPVAVTCGGAFLTCSYQAAQLQSGQRTSFELQLVHLHIGFDGRSRPQRHVAVSILPYATLISHSVHWEFIYLGATSSCATPFSPSVTSRITLACPPKVSRVSTRVQLRVVGMLETLVEGGCAWLLLVL